MTSSPSSPSVVPLQEILAWSKTRPLWQRDALRRIITQDSLRPSDAHELELICRSRGESSALPGAVKATPLESEHVPSLSDTPSGVSLVSITNLHGVNRIPSDPGATFGAAPGLTVIYGDNGSGKSGYARVIKKACRARGALPVIRPDVFASPAVGPAKADIKCSIGNVEDTVTWQDGVVSDARLSHVFVFDASTAGHYIEEDGPAAFTPYGLDVLPRLAHVCDGIGARIQKDIDALSERNASAGKAWTYSPATQVGRLLQSLSAATSTSRIDALVAMSDAEQARLSVIRDALKADPLQKARETRASASRLRVFAAAVRATDEYVSEKGATSLHVLIDEAVASQAVAKAFASDQFDAKHLPGTGGKRWRVLWTAAQEYSTKEAYVGQPSPAVIEGARCVLCQRELDNAAADRLHGFHVFFQNKSQAEAAAAAKVLNDTLQLIVKLKDLKASRYEVEVDLAIATKEQVAIIDAYVATASSRLSRLAANMEQVAWNELDATLCSPEGEILQFAANLDMRATVEDSANDPTARKLLTQESEELADRVWLGTVKQDVLDQIQRYKESASLRECLKDTATRVITDKNSELTALVVTKAYCDRFEAEIAALGLSTIKVKLEESGGKKGTTKFGIRLVGASAKVHEIASEGEYRCIALAAFLAELSQASHQSALVFDDPVSSLDFWHRERIAIRLVKEAAGRQVIVLTHDAVFLNDLDGHSRLSGIISTYRHVEWVGGVPGYCQEGLPWDCKSPEDRIDRLEKRQREMAAKWQPQPNTANVEDVRSAYSWLRATIERIVERVVFADVVFRFRSYVNMKHLADVPGFSIDECRELGRLHDRCCDVTDAHDPSLKRPIPDPAALARDIEDTKAILAAVRARRKAQKQSALSPTAV